MRAVITLLVLLFSMCGAQTSSPQTEVQIESQTTEAAVAATTEIPTLDVSAELTQLREALEKLETLVMELRVQLTVTQNELQNTKAENYVVMTEMMNQIKENAAQAADLTMLNTDLTSMKTEMMNLIKANAAQETELTAVKTRLAATETEVVNVEKEITEQPKVAFTVGPSHSGYIEAGSTDVDLVFTKIITNVGQTYSSNTGFFTAPVRGVYYFRFTVCDALNSRWMGIKMIKNGQQIMYLKKGDSDGFYDFLIGDVTLQLEIGDVVNLRLPGGYRLYDTTDNLSTFSGFLLFPL